MITKNEKIKVLIVDDEPFARKRVKDLLGDEKDFEIIGECSNGMEAVQAILDKPADLLFLDIQMPDMDGFEVLENLKNENLPSVIFVTAYDKYALRAFEIHAVDYLLKPFKDSRFKEVIDHFKKVYGKGEIESLSGKLTNLLISYQGGIQKEQQIESQSEEKIYQTRFIIKSTGKISFLSVDDVEWIGAEGPYVSLNIKNKAHLMRESLKNLEQNLDPNKFLRIHRSTIVNISCITELQPYSHGDYIVILSNGKKLKLSRGYRDQIEKILKN